jgi:motility quorum-sensing regulator/GCU-specific mRNA interferase toxin
MEKRRPHHDLKRVQAAVRERGADVFTRTALEGIVQLQLSLPQAISVVLGLSLRDFVKSMTTHVSSRAWQDVYTPRLASGKTAYVKVMLRDDGALVVSFKEK